MLESAPGIDAVAGFCTGCIANCAKASTFTERRRLGPLSVDVSAAEEQFTKRLFEGVVGEGSEERAADFRLYISVGPMGPLGPPPAEWPFDVTDRQSFHRVHWSPARGTALTSDEQSGVWNIADGHGARTLYWVANADLLPSWEYATPLRHHVHWQALRRQAILAHSAAIECANGCFLLTGPGGSGKSTTTVAALASGRKILAEDLCWIEFARNGIRAYPLYSSVKVTDEARERFPYVQRFISDHAHARYDKTLVYLDETEGQRGPADIRAMFCLSGDFGEETRIRPCGKLEAFKLLAPSTLFLMRTGAEETLPRLRNLVDRLPTYHVTLGPDPIVAVEALSEFVGQVQ